MTAENPFQDPLRFERRVPECAVVIFGANGDLTRRKLLPALYRLAYDRRLSAGFAIIGISRTPLSDEQFREKMREAVQQFSEDTRFDDNIWEAFAGGLFYVAGDIGDPELYRELAERLAAIEAQRHTGGNVLFYLSTQPSQYARTAQGIGEAASLDASSLASMTRLKFSNGNLESTGTIDSFKKMTASTFSPLLKRYCS